MHSAWLQGQRPNSGVGVVEVAERNPTRGISDIARSTDLDLDSDRHRARRRNLVDGGGRDALISARADNPEASDMFDGGTDGTQQGLDGDASRTASVAEVFHTLATSLEAGEVEKVLWAAGLEDARDAALDVFNVLENLRRRHRDLMGLYSSTRELAAVRPSDEVLQSIAQRACVLVPGAEVSAILVREPGGGFQVRASVGLISSALQSLHLKPGTGTTAKIAESGSSMWLRCYGDTELIDYEDALDVALAEEALISILGVPLKVHDEVVGVLYAASRFERTFSAPEQKVLEAFADHAAIALDNTRLFAELGAARQEAMADALALRRASELHDRLTPLVLQGAEVTDVVDEISSVFDGKVSVLESEPGPLMDVIKASHRCARAVETDEGYVAAFEGVIGQIRALFLRAKPPIAPAEVRNLERAAQILSLLAFRERAIVDAEERCQDQLFRDLAAGEPLTQSQRLLARSRGMDLNGPMVTVFARSDQGRLSDLTRGVASFAARHNGIGGEHGSGAGALLAGADGAALARALHADLSRKHGPGLIVCAAAPESPAGIAAQLGVAERATALLHALGRTNTAMDASELGVYSILVDPSRSEDLTSFLDTKLGPLIAHDEVYGTALVETVHAYLRLSGSVAGAARSLYVHSNTVVKRLARVTALLGEDWQSADRALELHMALQLRSIADRF